jgi:hypothetical protein
LQPLTVQYGRIKSFPDFAITPWSEFSGNDQYLNVLLAPGLGSFEYETLYIDDTILWTSGGRLQSGIHRRIRRSTNRTRPSTLFPDQRHAVGRGSRTGHHANAGRRVRGQCVGLDRECARRRPGVPGGCFNTIDDNGNMTVREP